MILYEIFTGQRPCQGSKAGDPRLVDESDALSNPSDIVDGIDPSVDRIIMRCLEHSPDNRPDSVAAVATALPEGDPLAAALAAGETPSPELVAASKGVGSLSIPKAIACLAMIITGLALMLPMVRVTEVFNRLPLTLKPQALEQSAKEIVKAFGYPDPAADSDYGFSYDNQVLDLVKNPDSRELRDRMFATQVPTPYYFWYRHSPRRLIPGVPTNVTYMGNGTPQVTETDPPSMAPDAISVKLGPDGRLLRFAAFPSKITATPQTPDSKSANAPAGVSWNEILDKSGWSLTDARESDTLIITSVPHDHGRAWDAQMQSHPEITIHVEVRMFADQLTFFSATTSELQPSFWPPTA